jgi:asparagine synthase (glutamine-hydrolysing)
MCAIVGFYGLRQNLPSLQDLKKCLFMMNRRGPDSVNKYIEHNHNFSIVFLQSRLSIIDPDPRSQQPMEDDEGVISFNGEIYNYLEIKNICLSKGAIFKTKSDTEVLLKILNIFGTKAFKYLDGDWAFSYYNKKNKEIIISRDRFGIKPLFFLSYKNNYYFASNINHLFTISGKQASINLSRIKSFLCYGFKAFGLDNGTFFSGIHNFPSSTYVIIKNGIISNPIKYWSPKIRINKKLNYNESVELVRLKFSESVKMRLRSDFPISCLLSGGIDSSAIAGVAKNSLNYDLQFYSYKTNNKNYNETDLIEANLKFLNGKHKYVELDFDDNIKELTNLIEDGGFPLNSLSSFAFHRLCKEIKKDNYRVVLSGVGGDELFGGNYIDHLNYLVSINDKKDFENSYYYWKKNIKPLIRSPVLKNYKRYLDNIKKKNATWHETSLISSYLNFIPPTVKQNYNLYSNDFFRNELSKCLFEENVPTHLFSMDQIAMFHSIESRYPFLSTDLYETVSTIPSEFLIKDAVSKKILRDSLNGIVPVRVLQSINKIGFYCDIKDIFKISSKNFEELFFSNSKLNSLVNVKKFRNLLKFKKIDVVELKLIFNFLNLAILLNAYDK